MLRSIRSSNFLNVEWIATASASQVAGSKYTNLSACTLLRTGAKRMKAQMAFVPCLIFVTITAWAKPLPTELFSRGYNVIPVPQKVNLQPVDIDFDGTWVYDSGPVGASHIAARTLVKDLKEFHSIELTPAGLPMRAKKSIRLSVVPGTCRSYT